MKQPKLKSLSFTHLPSLFLLILLLPPATADLNSDKQALLDFASAVHHGRKLNWSASAPICSSWVGVTCDINKTHVLYLRLPAIGLSGSLPPNTLGRLDFLRVLSLRSNRLSGNVPSDISSLQSLHFLFLQHNNLTGNIPSTLSPNFTFLDLSFNSIEGEIPPSIRNLTQLTTLNLHNNSLSGPIPDLNLRRLRHLNLSYNNLSGSIPLSLQKFPNSSFLGNPHLCGFPLIPCSPIHPPPSPVSPSLPPPPPTTPSKGKLSTAVIIAIAVGGFALLFLLAIILLLCYLRKKDGESRSSSKGKASGEKPKEEFGSGAQEAEKNKLVFFEGCSYNFDLEDLLRASAEVLGKGSCGTAYKAVLEDGTTVVVKRLKEVVVGKREFEQQMEIVGRVGQHPNVVPLRAYYYSKDEKLMVHDYIAAGSLSGLLHGMPSLIFILVSW